VLDEAEGEEVAYPLLRDRARTYAMITRDMTRVKLRLKIFFRSRALPCTGEAVYRPEERVKRARALAPGNP
jgi:hypothetical protein